MLTIREQQLAAMEETSRETFRQRIRAYLAEQFPETYTAYPPIRWRELLDMRWTEANLHGFSSELGVCSYLEAVTIFGENFVLEQAWAEPIREQILEEPAILELVNKRMLDVATKEARS